MKLHHASFIALTVVAALFGCEKPDTAVKTETVATVDGDDISKAELDLALSRLGELSDAQAAEAKSKLLQALVDQRLVEQAARKAGLDKERAVEIAMAQASRQVLAEAYIERNFKDVGKPSDAEIAEYFDQHPELFSQRRIYRLQEIELNVDPSRMTEIQGRLESSRSMGDFVNWLKEQNIDGKAAVAVKPAEQIPTPLLARLVQMKDGQVTILAGRPGQVLVVQLQESQLQPVTLEQANGAISRALTTLKRKELMEADLKKLREAAKIEFASGYAPVAEAPAGTGKADSEKADEKPVDAVRE